MKKIAVFLIGLSAVFLFWSVFLFDTSIPTNFGRINNLGLMNDKQNYIILSGGAFIVGLIIYFFDNNITEAGPAINNNIEDDWCDIDDLNDDAYKIYLTKKYNLEKNVVLEKIIFNNQLYDNVQAALAAANEIEAVSRKKHEDSVEAEKRRHASNGTKKYPACSWVNFSDSKKCVACKSEIS